MHRFSFRVGAVAVIPLMVAPALMAGGPPTTDDLPQTYANPSVGKYAKRTVGPAGWVMAGVGAATTQGTNTPSEWGQGAVGFGRRFASGFGKHIVSNIIRYPIARFRHEELAYRPSGKQGFKARLKYALLSVIITHDTRTGESKLYSAEFGGAIGAGLISRLWQPASTRTIGLGFSSAGTSLAVDAGIHVIREFWPEIRHPHRHSAQAAAAAALAEPVVAKPEEAESEEAEATPSPSTDPEDDSALTPEPVQ